MRTALFFLVSCLWSTVALAAAPRSDVLVQFDGEVQDLEYDVARARIYVTVPQLNQLVVVNANNWLIEEVLTVAPSPQGVALSLDGTQLFVAKRGAGSVAVIDPETLDPLGDIFLTPLLDDPRTYDVICPQPNRLYVSSNPGSNGFAYIVQVKLDEGNAAQRVASNRIIRCNPTFEGSRDFTSLYVGECFSPASVYKLDLIQPNAPIVAEDDHGSVGGTYHLETNPDNTRVFLGSGQILTAGSLDVTGQIGSGISRFDVDPNRIFVAKTPNQIQTWDVVSQTQVDTLILPCSFSSIHELLVLPGETGFIVLGDDRLCGVAEIPPCDGIVESTCVSAPNSVGPGAVLSAIGEPKISQNDFGFAVDGVPSQQFGIVFFGSDPAQLPFGDGWLCISPFDGGLTRIPAVYRADAAGHAELTLDFLTPPLLNGPVISYTTWYFQAWYRDPQGPLGLGMNTSDALKVTFCP